ncbi:MAG: oligosaccharide flippase family protein [Bacillota bacterium]
MSLIWSTSLLTAGSLIGRCYGFFLRIILARMLGAEGLGAYQMVLTFFMAVSGPFASALPVTVSRVVAAHRHEGINRRRLLLVATGLSAAGCALAVGTLLAFHQFRPVALLGQIERVTPWFWLIPAMALTLVAQAVRGYYLGINRVLPMVISQHVEQLFEIAWLLVLSRLAVLVSPAQKIPLVIAGMTLADLVNSLYLLATMRGGEKQGLKPGRWQPGIVREMIGLGLPFCLSRLVGSVSRVVEATLIPLCLVRSGMSGDRALAVYGQVTGLALPMLFFPAMIITSLSSTLVPAVAESMKRPEVLARRIRQGVSIGLMVGCGAAVLFCTRGSWLGVFLFADQQAGEIMASLAPVAIFWYLDIVTGNLLRGLGRPIVGMVSDVVGSALRIGYMLWSVVGGMETIRQAILTSSLLSAAINWAAVVILSSVSFDWYLWLLSPVLSGAAMAAILGTPVYALGPFAILLQLGLALTAYIAVWFLLNLHPTRGEIFSIPTRR